MVRRVHVVLTEVTRIAAVPWIGQSTERIGKSEMTVGHVQDRCQHTRVSPRG